MHGGPDYGVSTAKQTVYALADMAELAARLGSIVTFDRRGDVIFLDDFESGLAKWEISGSGAGYAAAQSAFTARNGAYSAKLTTGSTLGQQIQIARYMPYPVLSSFGLEVSFTINANLDYMRFQLEIYDGVNAQSFSMQYEVDTDELKVFKGGVGYTVIASGLALRPYDQQFHTMKLVGDYATKKYRRLILNERFYDLSSWNSWQFASANAPRLTALVLATSVPAANTSFYVDDAIITQNEP